MANRIKIDPTPKHTISPYLYMQFMEPLGVCDSSVDAAWDFIENDWYPLVIEKVRDLAPTMVRLGGCFASYYHWKEAIGRQSERIPMINYCWSGIYANQVGTHEFVDFCRRVDAEPLIVVNMESDGRPQWQYPKNGTVRFGTDDEAAEWVSYCNDAENPLREKCGQREPYNVRYWQIGNETSYFADGYSLETAHEATKRFVDKMRRADDTITTIIWGDKAKDGTVWSRKMAEVDGADMIAFHHHFGSGLPDSPLVGTEYRRDTELTWHHLMNACHSMEDHIAEMRDGCGSKKLAMTEGHFALPGRNRNEVLSSWGAGAAYARCHNVIMRNSDILEIATLADFFGNLWQCNAMIIPTPFCRSMPYLQPVGEIMKLYGRHQGEKYLDLTSDNVDVTASITGDTVYLHVVNTDMKRVLDLDIAFEGRAADGGRMWCIAEDPALELTPSNRDAFRTVESEFSGGNVTIPPAGVAAIELTLKAE